jgi:hypothetical protein
VPAAGCLPWRLLCVGEAAARQPDSVCGVGGVPLNDRLIAGRYASSCQER